MNSSSPAAIPADRLYDAGHDLWVQVAADGTALIGATAFGLLRAGEIIGFAAKPQGAVIERGRGLGTVELAKTVLALHAPVSGVLLEGNAKAEAAPQLIHQNPCCTWLVRLQLSRWPEEAQHLLDAAAYRAHVSRCAPELVTDSIRDE